MAGVKNIDNIIRFMRDNGFATIKRNTHQYDMQGVLNIVTTIGRCRLSSFVIDDKNRFAYENIIKWLMGDPTMKAINPTTGSEVAGRLNAGLYIAGGTGTGKSWCLDILRVFAKLYHLTYLEGDVSCGIQWDSLRCDEVCDNYAVNGELARYKSMRTVCFHDLGAEPTESLFMGNRQNVMKQIIECRGDRSNLFTHFTSNYPMSHDKLKQRYGDRVCSRLLDMCNYITIKGSDRRKH